MPGVRYNATSRSPETNSATFLSVRDSGGGGGRMVEAPIATLAVRQRYRTNKPMIRFIVSLATGSYRCFMQSPRCGSRRVDRWAGGWVGVQAGRTDGAGRRAAG